MIKSSVIYHTILFCEINSFPILSEYMQVRLIWTNNMLYLKPSIKPMGQIKPNLTSMVIG